MVTMHTIREHNTEAGQHFFDRATMKFFNSIVESGPYEGPGGVYFVTSERYDNTTPRKFSVRQYDPANGHCWTAGGFNEIRTREEAIAVAKEQAGGS